MPRPAQRPGALPYVIVGAGVLLGALALGLAWWSKDLTKDVARSECAARAGGLGQAIARELDELRAQVAEDPGSVAKLPEVRAAWRLAGGRVVARNPADAPDPPRSWLDELARYDDRRPLPLSDRGPEGQRAGTWTPAADGGGLLLRWDLEAVRVRVVEAALADAAKDGRYRAELITADTEAKLFAGGFRSRAETPLFPPLGSWRIGVGFHDLSGMRAALRVQTTSLTALAGCSLVVLVAGVWLLVRRERRRAQAARAREQFLARATHELQTPLALLRAATETLARGAAEGADRERCLAIVTREEERVTRTVRRLLRYLRFEGAGEREQPSAPLREVVEAVIEELHPSLTAAGLELEVELGPVAGLVAADLLRDTLTELLANARKHAGQGARVRVSTQTLAPGRAQLAIEDTGPGIAGDPEDLFRPWTQGEASAGRAGSGLGLALLREGWTSLGGAIRAERPARFVVEVPLS
ncbi:MAG: sensor histidine kinase [Planctomycetota bacterium]